MAFLQSAAASTWQHAVKSYDLGEVLNAQRASADAFGAELCSEVLCVGSQDGRHPVEFLGCRLLDRHGTADRVGSGDPVGDGGADAGDAEGVLLPFQGVAA